MPRKAHAIDPIFFNNLFTNLTYLKPALCFSNSPWLKDIVGEDKEVFLIVLIDKNENILDGICSWGDTGFSFKIKSKIYKYRGDEYRRINVAKRGDHATWVANQHNRLMEEIMEAFIEEAEDRIDLYIEGGEIDYDENYQGFYFQRKAEGKHPTTTFITRAAQLKAAQVVTDQFYKFVVKHSTKLTIGRK